MGDETEQKCMYLALEDDSNVVGIVENGEIIVTYSRTETVDSVLKRTASPVDSNLVGERVSANALVQVIQKRGEYELSWTASDVTVTVDGSETFENIKTLSNRL